MSEQRTLARPMPAPRGGVRVVAVEGADAGASIDVTRRVVIGTSEACDLRLSDPSVSRRHLVVEPARGGARARDEGSRNGTWLGEVRVHAVELPPGSRVRIGDTVLEIQLGEAGGPSVLAPATSRFGGFLGGAPALRQLYGTLTRAAPTDATILLEGESGTGKEVLAEAIHEHSGRAGGPFVVIDCGSLPETLIESEIFGHERGAFTGADRKHAGAFERADGGTLFLDEIGELPLAMQTRLLRALEQRKIRRLGGAAPIDVDVRIVAATNRDLDREVERGAFRLDLFHRLAVVLVRVPPLRERVEDIELIARELAKRFGREEIVTPAIVDRLREHAWPGNVRELRNYVERLALVGDAGELRGRGAAASAPRETGTAARSGLPFRQARSMALEAFTNEYVDDMLRRHGGNVSAAARAAGIGRRYFQRLKQDEDDER